jgi:hypothetical protein
VDADLARRAAARADKTVRSAGGNHDDMAGAGLDRLIVDGEGRAPFLGMSRGILATSNGGSPGLRA